MVDRIRKRIDALHQRGLDLGRRGAGDERPGQGGDARDVRGGHARAAHVVVSFGPEVPARYRAVDEVAGGRQVNRGRAVVGEVGVLVGAVGRRDADDVVQVV